MYSNRLARNLRKVIEETGFKIDHRNRTLESISARHIWNVGHGKATMTVATLEALADEIGVDMLEFFRE